MISANRLLALNSIQEFVSKVNQTKKKKIDIRDEKNIRVSG